MKAQLFFKVCMIGFFLLVAISFNWGQQGHFVTNDEGVRIEGTGTIAALTFFHDSSQKSVINAFNDDLYIINSALGDLNFSTNNQIHMKIDENGNWGLGRSSAIYKADIVGDRIRLSDGLSAAAKSIMLRTDAADVGIQASNTNLFLSALGNDVNINPFASDGNVWMNGTTLASGATVEEVNLIDSDMNLEDPNPYIRLIQHGTTTNKVGGIDFKDGDESVYRMNYNYDTNKLFFNNGFTVNGNKDLLIDLTSGDVSVGNNFKVGGSIVFDNNTSFYDAGANDILSSGNIKPSIEIYSLGSANDRWTAVYAVNGTIQTSDASLKNNIQSLDYGLDHVMKLRPVSFQWNSGPDQSTKIGYVAQEVQDVIPEVVHSEDYVQTESGDIQKVKNDVLGMSYTSMVPILTKAIQEQQALIKKLEKRIDELEKDN